MRSVRITESEAKKIVAHIEKTDPCLLVVLMSEAGDKRSIVKMIVSGRYTPPEKIISEALTLL